jgi:hypothetical protein
MPAQVPTEFSAEQRLFDELKYALQQTGKDDLKAWGIASATRLPSIGMRRIKNLGHLVSDLSHFAGREAGGIRKAWREDRLGEHIGQRSAAAIDTTIETSQRISQTCYAVGSALFSDPKKNAPGVLALALGFITGSGGLDGNGGVPDTDIAMFGIGDHRSFLTHSIIAGIVIEGAILALADLSGIVCDKLPEGQRSAFWDTLSSTKDQIANKLAVGASAGIAYHLAVDATIQPAAYKDLPLSMPMEAHQTLFALNAAAEGVDAANRAETTGQKVVNTVSDGFGAIGTGINALFGRR